MKLSELDIIVTAPPAPGWGGRYFILVKLTTDTGITGWGECYGATVGPKAMEAVIRDVFARHMRGEAPQNVELMFRRAYSAGFTQRPDLTVMGAFSGLEIACWDILGKARGEPVYALLGGKVADRIRAYTYLYPTRATHHLPEFWVDPAMAAEAAVDMVDQGYTAVKFDPAGPYTIRSGHMPSMRDLSRSAAFCEAIREAVGDRADLLFGTHGQFSAAGALRIAKAIGPYDPLWFEEPVPPDMLSEMAVLGQNCTVPIATGERLTTLVEFAQALRHGVSIVQPALGRAGGLWQAKKIATMAEAHNAQVAPHLYAGPVEWAANLHLSASIPNGLLLETIETPFHADLVNGALKVENGFVAVPDTPGLGIDVNEELARAHPYSGTGLHLEAQEAPVSYHEENVFEGGAPARE